MLRVKEIPQGSDETAEFDLDEFSLAELQRLQKDVAKAIKSFEARRMKQARTATEAAVRELGFSLDEVAAMKSKTKTAAKYQHPENPELTWTGRGRKPLWFLAALDSGKSAEDLLIG